MTAQGSETIDETLAPKESLTSFNVIGLFLLSHDLHFETFLHLAEDTVLLNLQFKHELAPIGLLESDLFLESRLMLALLNVQLHFILELEAAVRAHVLIHFTLAFFVYGLREVVAAHTGLHNRTAILKSRVVQTVMRLGTCGYLLSAVANSKNAEFID